MAAAKDMDVQVSILPQPSNGQPVSFVMDPPNLVFENDKHDGFWVHFHIKNFKDTDYRFPDSPSDAMWVQAIDEATPASCPRQPMYWTGFRAKEVTNDNVVLTVRNKNGPLNGKLEQLFAFTLLFTTTPHDPNPVCVEFDPIGVNKNGSTGYSSAALIVGLVVVGAAALIGYKLLLS